MFIDAFLLFFGLHGPFEMSFYEITVSRRPLREERETRWWKDSFGKKNYNGRTKQIYIGSELENLETQYIDQWFYKQPRTY